MVQVLQSTPGSTMALSMAWAKESRGAAMLSPPRIMRSKPCPSVRSNNMSKTSSPSQDRTPTYYSKLHELVADLPDSTMKKSRRSSPKRPQIAPSTPLGGSSLEPAKNTGAPSDMGPNSEKAVALALTRYAETVIRASRATKKAEMLTLRKSVRYQREQVIKLFRKYSKIE